MDFSAQDRTFMQQALDLAAPAAGRVEPNPLVGAVIVRDGRVLGQGVHERFGGPHAEAMALRAVAAAGQQARGATLYCTLEPCTHHGKTPPCAPALVQAGIARAVLATHDPLWARHAEARGPSCSGDERLRGVEALRQAGVEVEVGLMAREAVVLNAAFFKRAATGLPLVIAKWAMSADGRIATRTGASRWISSPDSRRLVHELRGRVDAVVVGVRTVLVDDPMLTCRLGPPRRTAARVVLCGKALPGPGSALARTAREAPVVLAFAAATPPPGLDELQESGCELLPLPPSGAGHGVSLPDLLRALGERGASNVLVEGGGAALGSFFDAGLVDRVMVFVAPVVVGGSDALAAVGGRGADTVRSATQLLPGASVSQVGCDALIEGWVSDPLQWQPAETGRVGG